MLINEFESTKFLAEYWQKKPCIIKGFVKSFVDPIDEHDLAGLAQEDGVDCRIVTMINEKWRVSQGPFRDFEEHCVGQWSLLVQGVDKYIDEVSELAECVNFIPYWRFDDVMISYSVPGAGVGAHVDQYDVFIVQGKGSRRWQVGLPEKISTIVPHPLLKQIKDFEPVIDEILAQGDAIYIPPLHPHKGVTIEPCLNYSLGFRAPTNVDMLNGILDSSEGFEPVHTRYTDPTIHKMREPQLQTQEISNNELAKLKSSLFDLLNTPEADDALLRYLSVQHLPTEEFNTDEAYLFSDIEMLVHQNAQIKKLPGVRPIYHEQQYNVFSFYIDGNAFDVDIQLQEQTKVLLASDSISLADTVAIFNHTDVAAHDRTLYKAWLRLVCSLLNKGLWEVISDS